MILLRLIRAESSHKVIVKLNRLLDTAHNHINLVLGLKADHCFLEFGESERSFADSRGLFPHRMAALKLQPMVTLSKLSRNEAAASPNVTK